jgi:hypothetical protein
VTKTQEAEQRVIAAAKYVLRKCRYLGGEYRVSNLDMFALERAMEDLVITQEEDKRNGQ